jgi:Ca2+-binding EF-hand superfamily protein
MMLLMAIQQGTGSDTNSTTSSDSTASGISGISDSILPAPPSLADDIASDITSTVDSDGSGGISKNEMETFAQSSGGTTDEADQIFSALDANSDGSVSATEIADNIKRLMETMQATMAGQALSSISVTA